MARFKKGESGNPKGRAVGSMNKATIAALKLLEGDFEAITQKCVDKAKEGDLMAVKMVLDKVIPNAKERRVSIKLPQVKKAGDLPAALAKILELVAASEITPGEGQTIASMIEAYRKGIELADIEARLRALEEKTNAKN